MALIEKLLEHGPHGNSPGLDHLLNTQRLEQALDLVRNDPALPFNDALQQTGADLSNLPTSMLRDIVQSQPPEVQQQVAQWASSGELPGGVHRLGLADAPVPAPGPPNLPGPGDALPAPGDALPGNVPQGPGNVPPGSGNVPQGPGNAPPGSGDAPPGPGNAPPGSGDAPPGPGNVPPGPGSASPGPGNAPPGPGNAPPGPGTTPPGPANAPPGPGSTPATVQANAASNAAPAVDAAAHATPGAPNGGIRAEAAPGEMIQRLFDGRVDGNQPLAAMRMPGGENPRADAAQSVVMARGENAVHQDALQQPGQLPRGRGDGLVPGQAPAAANAQPQGATQMPGLTGAQQALAQNVPLAQGRPDAQQPGQHNALLARGDAPVPAQSALPSQTALPQQAVAATQARPDALATQLQAQGQTALAAAAQARPDALATQLQAQGQTALAAAAQARPEGTTVPPAPLLAGVTVMAAAPTPALNPQSTQPPQAATLAQNAAAAQAREPLLAPAGHTLAGFLRRDPRRRQALPRRPIDRALALLLGARKRAAESDAESISSQWLFWLLTVVAYGSLAIALIAMVPTGGRLLDADGAPTPGGYALLIGGIAALASWLVARRLSRRE